MTSKPDADHRARMATLAWRMVRLSEETMRRLWELFEEEFLVEVEAAVHVDDDELPF